MKRCKVWSRILLVVSLWVIASCGNSNCPSGVNTTEPSCPNYQQAGYYNPNGGYYNPQQQGGYYNPQQQQPGYYNPQQPGYYNPQQPGYYNPNGPYRP